MRWILLLLVISGSHVMALDRTAIEKDVQSIFAYQDKIQKKIDAIAFEKVGDSEKFWKCEASMDAAQTAILILNIAKNYSSCGKSDTGLESILFGLATTRAKVKLLISNKETQKEMVEISDIIYRNQLEIQKEIQK